MILAFSWTWWEFSALAWGWVAVAAGMRGAAEMGAPGPAGGVAVATVPGRILWGVVGAGHLLMFAKLPDVATLTAAVSGLAIALLGLYTVGLKQITAAKIDAAKAWEEANKGSLAAQLAALKDQNTEAQSSIDKARDSLHALRNEAQAEQLRLREQIEELKAELHATREDLKSTRAEYRLLLQTTRQARDIAKGNKVRLDRIDPAGSGDGEEPGGGSGGGADA
jgi:hypothetical protein